MKSVVCAAALFACLCVPAHAESGGGRWLRRVTLAAACAASFWDFQTTRTAVARGAREANGFFADAAGNPRWGRIAGMKAGICVGSAVAQDLIFRHKPVELPWIAVNGGLAAYYSAVALHNRGVAAILESRPRAPSYLLRPDVAP